MKVVNGTTYPDETPEQVIKLLEHSRLNNQRIRVFYGDVETGMCWNDEFDTIGTVGRSTGEIKIPILLHNSKSTGGGAILVNRIVAIQFAAKLFGYKHPKFNIGEWKYEKDQHTSLFVVYQNNSLFSIHNTEEKAKKYIAFMKGERWCK